MADSPSHQVLPPIPRTNLETLYYGLIIVSIAATVLFIYNLIILRWCVDRRPSQALSHHNPEPSTSRSSHINYVYSYKHKKDGVVAEYEGNGDECVVCLSVFEEGEHLRQLLNCKHCFHANCIDMWLHSHMDCPLCRTSVEPTRVVVTDHSHEGSYHETLV